MLQASPPVASPNDVQSPMGLRLCLATIGQSWEIVTGNRKFNIGTGFSPRPNGLGFHLGKKMIEITVKVSNEEKRMTKKHLVDGHGIQLDRGDPTLMALVEEGVKEFVSAVDDVKIIITMVW